jgi:hypothetical protein
MIGHVALLVFGSQDMRIARRQVLLMRRGHEGRLPQRETKFAPTVIFDGTEGGRQVLNATLADFVLRVRVSEGDRGDEAVFPIDGVPLELEDVSMTLPVAVMLSQEGRGVVTLEELTVFGDPLIEPVPVHLVL